MNDKTEWVMVPRELTVGMAIAADKAWRTGDDGYKVPAVYSAMIAAAPTPPAQEPIPMVLHCQKCGTQHIDAPEESAGWANPPHRSHLCHACGHIWRPADVPTTGVAAIQTRGKNDSPPAQAAQPVEWRDPTNLNPGQSVTFQLDVHLKWSHIFRQPLYAAPIPAQQEPKK